MTLRSNNVHENFCDYLVNYGTEPKASHHSAINIDLDVPQPIYMATSNSHGQLSMYNIG